MIDALPPGFVARPATPDDAPAIAALVGASRVLDAGDDPMDEAELRDDWAGVDLAAETVVVVAPDGRPAGYADVLNRANVVVSVYGFVDPVWRGRGVGGALVRWGETWTRDRIPEAPEGARVVVQHYVAAANAGGRDLMEQSGYQSVRQVYEMEIELVQAPPDPVWPDGITVRTFVQGEDDRRTFEAVEDAFRDHWGRPPGTFDRFVRMFEGEGFDPGLWLLAEDGNEIAGTTLAKVVAGMGWISDVGVRRPWRGRGLGLALLRQAFAAFYERGVRRVGLSVDAESATGAPRLYARAGMRVVRAHVLYRKELRPGFDPVAATDST